MSRSMYLDMCYNMSHSLLDTVPTDQLIAEVPLLYDKASALNLVAGEANENRNHILSKASTLKEIIERRANKELKNNFVLTDDHKKLLAKIDWHRYNLYDRLEIEDVVTILGWEKPNDDPSNKQIADANKLLKELPLAMTEIMDNLK